MSAATHFSYHAHSNSGGSNNANGSSKKEKEPCPFCPPHNNMTEWWNRFNALKRQYERAVKAVQHLKKRPSDDELLQLYGLYKQVSEGDCPEGERAALWDLKQKRKVAAWSQLRGVDQVDAMQRYIDIARSFVLRYGVVVVPGT